MMLNRYFVLFYGLLLTSTTLKAGDPGPKAGKLVVKKNIRYAEPPEKGIKEKYYLLDIYMPEKDNSASRPLIIMMHGGGFKLGSKKSNSTPVFAKSFAQQGYICASINYRLSKKKPLSKFADLAEGCFDAIEDLQQAILFLKKNAAQYGIDTNKIILAGNSAGGMTALQAVFSTPEQLARLFNTSRAKLLSHETFIKNISAVVNCWGGIYDSSWLKNAIVPVISIHGSKDRVVPINFTDSTVFGSAVIHRQLNVFSIPNQLKIFEGAGHELAKPFNPLWSGPHSKKNCREAAVYITEFLSRQLSK